MVSDELKIGGVLVVDISFSKSLLTEALSSASVGVITNSSSSVLLISGTDDGVLGLLTSTWESYLSFIP
ncbi:hypothetical protein QUF74_00095 [Candidatus Halobeggiatoa sp. HSG11]|nr:hypothetical protein [Candidatus Halobeggiatoa sp. HSG11]